MWNARGMEDHSIAFRVVRSQTKRGSGRQTTRRPFALTTRLADVLPLTQQQKCSNAAPAGGCMSVPRASAFGVVPSRVMPSSCDVETDTQKHTPELHFPCMTVSPAARDNGLGLSVGSGCHVRVKVTAARLAGSGRRTTPREFSLELTLPQLLRAPTQPHQPTGQSLAGHQALQQSHTLPALQQGTAECPRENTGHDAQPSESPSPALPPPSIEDLLALALEKSSAREVAADSALGAPGFISSPGSRLARRDGTAWGRTRASVAAELSMLAAVTPAAQRAPGLWPLAGSPQQPSPGHVPTPIEGVPERFSCSVGNRNAAAAAKQVDTANWREREAAHSEAQETCSSSGTGMTPIEGVPERLAKRRRLSSLPQPQRLPAVKNSTPRGMGQIVAHAEALGLGLGASRGGLLSRNPLEMAGTAAAAGSLLEDDGGAVQAQAVENVLEEHLTAADVEAAMAAVTRAAVERIHALMGATTPSEPPGRTAAWSRASRSNSEGVTPAGSAQNLPLGEPVSANRALQRGEEGEPTAAAIAAAAVTAATAALRRLQPSGWATPPEASAAARTESHSSASGRSKQSAMSSDGTPAVVKIHNLAAAVEDMVQRATQNMGGLPSYRSAQSLLRSGLPPRPPSAAGRAAGGSATGERPATAMHEEEARRRSASSSEGQPPGLASIIHRAPLDSLLFPSRTPSPMGGYPWGPVLQMPEPQLAAGSANGAGMVTPMTEATLAPFAGVYAAAAATTQTPVVAANHGAIPVVAPTVVTAATSPFTAADFLAAAAAPVAAPASTNERSRSEGLEHVSRRNKLQSAARGLAHSGRADPGEDSHGSLRQGCRTNPGHSGGDNHHQSSSEGSELGDGEELVQGDGVDIEVEQRSCEDAGHLDGSESEQSGGEEPATSHEFVEQSSSQCSEQSDEEDDAQINNEGPDQGRGEGMEQSSSSSSGESLEPSDEEEARRHSGEGAENSSGESSEPSEEDQEQRGVENPGWHDADQSPAGACAVDPSARTPPAVPFPACAAVAGHDTVRTGPAGPDSDPARMLASALRHDYQKEDANDDDDLAMEEVMALPDPPDEPEPPKAAAQAAVGSGDAKGVGPSSQPTAMQQPTGAAAAPAGAAAAGAGPSGPAAQRPSGSHQLEKRLLNNRKSLAGVGLTIDEAGTRRSTRTRVRPLEYWRGEGKRYGRNHNTMPTVTSIKMRTPEPQWPLPSGKAEKAKRKARTKMAAGATAAAMEEQ